MPIDQNTLRTTLRLPGVPTPCWAGAIERAGRRIVSPIIAELRRHGLPIPVLNLQERQITSTGAGSRDARRGPIWSWAWPTWDDGELAVDAVV